MDYILDYFVVIDDILNRLMESGIILFDFIGKPMPEVLAENPGWISDIILGVVDQFNLHYYFDNANLLVFCSPFILFCIVVIKFLKIFLD